MAKIKNRRMYRLTVPEATVEAIANQYPHLRDKDGAIDDVLAVNTALNEWLRSVSGKTPRSTEEIQQEWSKSIENSEADDIEGDDLPPIH